MVKDDLNSIMEKSVDISMNLVNNLDNRMMRINAAEAVEEAEAQSAPQLTPLPGNKSDKVRIYELARMLEMNPRELISKLQEAGYPYNHPLNTVDQITVNTIRMQLLNGLGLIPKNGGKQNQDNIEGIQLQLLEKTKPEEDPLSSINDLEENEAWLESLKEAHPYLAVKTLADKGYSVREIAKFLDRGQGEVSLILSLSRKKRATM